MVVLKRLSAVALSLAVQAAALAGGAVDVDYRRGLDAYQQGQWVLAVQEFESILVRGYEAENLYYNLGNGYYRNGQLGGAVWAYEKALQLDPNDPDTRYNLALVNAQLQDRLELPEMPFIIRFYRGVRRSLVLREWAMLVSFILLASATLYAALRLLRWPWLRGFVYAGWVTALLFGLVAADGALATGKTETGIINAGPLTVYSEPSGRSTELFEIHEGLKVTIVGDSRGWFEIELLDGKSGWLQEGQVRTL